VALTGKQKAAMLLMSLDAATAAEMLKGVDPKVVQELAVELSYLDSAGYRNSREMAETARQFCDSLQRQPAFQFKSFLNEMLKSTVGDEKATHIQTQIQDMLLKRDPFMEIRSVDAATLSSVLEGEHPQAAAVVLSELPPKKSSELLGLLGEGVRLSAIRRMTNVDAITVEAKARIAEMIQKRLGSATAGPEAGAVQAKPEQSLRKVAVVLRNLGTELRDGLLGAVREKSGEVGEQVANLMVVWEDIPQVADRSLQEAVRGVDEQALARALFEADDAIAQKIRSNISERAAAMVDEETSLMGTPKKEEIEEAREKIVDALREMNSRGELTFVEE
jgi:flagellar motor switch protein FliG